MDRSKLENKTIKKIIPVKGNLKTNLLKKFKESQSVENGFNDSINNNQAANAVLKVKEPLKSPENKIIIQKVESVKLEIIKTNPKAQPRRISSLFTFTNEQNQLQSQSDHSTRENDVIQPEIVEKLPDSVQSNSNSPHSSVKLLTAKIPENSCNKSVPLKMIRTIKGPKPKPNLLHRIHRVQTNISPEPSAVESSKTFDYSSVRLEALHPDITMTEESHVDDDVKQISLLPKDPKPPGFSGFEDLATFKESDIGLWKDILKYIPKEDLKSSQEATSLAIVESPTKRLKFSCNKSPGQRQRFHIKTINSPQQIIKLKLPETKSTTEKTELKISSASKKYLEILSQKDIMPQESSSAMMSKELHRQEANSPSKKKNISHAILPLKKSPSKIETVDQNVTKTSPVAGKVISSLSAVSPKFSKLQKASTAKCEKALIPSTSKALHKSETEPIVKTASLDWMKDILTVIGSSRIEKIDESLKEIPNLITGNFSAIETENVEFKLIIKHLLRELGVESIMETLNFFPKNGSMSLSKDGDNDDEDSNDDFTESFDDESYEHNNFFTEESNTNDQNFEDDNCRNYSYLPNTSLSLATSFDEVPTVSFHSEPYVLGKSSVESDPLPQEAQSNDEKVKVESILGIQTNLYEDDRVEENKSTGTIAQVNKEPCNIKYDMVECSRSTDRKRKYKTISRTDLDSSSKKIKKNQRLPWGLLLDGEVRRSSLRSSSRESSVEPNKELKQSEKTPKKELEKLKTENKDLRSSPRLSSRESSTEPAKTSTSLKLLKTKKESAKLKVNDDVLRSSPRLSSRGSSVESPKPTTPVFKGKVIEKNPKKIDSESDSGESEVFQRSTRMRPLHPLSDDSIAEETLKTSRDVSHSDDSDAPLIRKSSKQEASNNTKGSKINRERKAKSDKTKKTCKLFESDSAPENFNETRKIELESRLAPFDSSSGPKSSILIRNNYLKSSDKRAAKERTEINNMMEKFASTIAKKKNNDPTYVEPPDIEKRPRLKTSAFKGTDENKSNSECSNDEDIQASSVPNTNEPSVSSSRASSTERSAESLNLQDRMKNLIEKEKQKLSKTTPEKRRGRRMPYSTVVIRKEFVQEPLEAAIEMKVPYDEILQSIKVTNFSKRIGRTSFKTSKEDEARREENLKKLRGMKYFRCGSCRFEVTKHKWVEHFLEHGGLAWVDILDAPILLSDWNEAIRRTNHSFKIYNVVAMKCPTCYQEKRSALGHLSHLLTCGESEEAIEQKKISCAHCSERFLPFNASAHKTKCPGLLTVGQKADDGDDEDEQESDETSPELFNSSGRRKRKAVKKAEKKFKKILTNLDEASDHLQIISGHIKCHICGETNFVSKKEALEHVKEQHNASLSGDFEASDSDVSIKAEDSSEETEGSSGVESSDIEASNDENEEMSDNDDKLVSSKKARLSATEPQEVKNGRALMSEYVDTIRNKDMTPKTIQWTREFVDEYWKVERLKQHVPRLLSKLTQDPKVVLPILNFNLKSMLFGTRQVDNYSSSFGIEYKNEWKQLEIGEHDSNKQSMIIHCGGSVAAVDWAPSSSDLNFLAVACNSCSKGIKMDLEYAISSCVQLYEFKNLKNDKFQGFENSSKLCYVIIIEDGPIWSIKFHPGESPLDKRVGLLAVTSANQNIFIYSMPYRSEEKSIILPISPSVVCKLKESETFFNEKYLLQASRVSWFIKNDGESVLAAGYVSGLIAVWNVSDCLENKEAVYPAHVIQAHLETITALDFKATNRSEFHLVTASLDRKIKVFIFDEFRFQEISCHYAVSRVLCAEWWLHWPGFIVGFDDCFTYGSIIHRQPLEFGSRNSPLLAVSSSITHFSINHWLNFVMFVSDSGDVLGCNPGQMLQTYPKDKWSYFNFSMFSSTDYNKITKDGVENIGIVFSDFKTTTRQPKSYRLASVNRINELLINQICFNRNEKSYRFYALGFETGFVRIRYLKNSK